ncbi:Basic-leucine zipper (bZIP) transcription factor family protein [Actinidia rufa]|uniref:Basic-leucine zipper (BZIP) transcription factor family protein n=1 Tax=Actinidia rufa TaxID=165716 RepID=A0A7J0E183_9ERIC|nr:Basic-leucine zipper (bZIP) transcription factor family protein [Actinidia rufa]
MAHLPPKVPSMIPSWGDFPHQRMASMENLPPTTTPQNLSWVYEFHDHSTAKRGSHRRSISDSIASIEPPMVEECRKSGAALGWAKTNNEFDRFDDDQLMSMFADEIAAGPTISLSNTSSPSDHNSNNDDKQAQINQQQLKNEPEEVQSPCKLEAQVMDNSADKIIDPKRIKRILANRQSAQRSRVRKLRYISELERSVTSLQAEVSVLSPRVAFLDHQRLILNVDNSALKQRIAALAQDKIFKDARQQALRREIERLRKVYQEQNLKKMENSAQPENPPAATDANGGSTENEQILS